MADPQWDEITRQLRLLNRNLAGIGVCVLLILACLIALLMRR